MNPTVPSHLRERLTRLIKGSRPILHGTLFLLFLLSYTKISRIWGGLPPLLPAWQREIPLLLYLFFYFRSIVRPSRWQPVIAALPVVLIYVVFDIYHVLFGRLLRIIEVTELPEMFIVLPWLNKILLVLAVGLPLLVLLRHVQWRSRSALIWGALPLLALTVAIEIFPARSITAFEWIKKPIHWMSDTEQARLNGRISMSLYNEARRVNSLNKTIAYRDNIGYLDAFDEAVQIVKTLPTKHNVHLIVLESFLDPTLLRDAVFSRNPAHPAFQTLFRDRAGLSISPVFGGSTAQAEFEVLCGVPALRELSGIEFDVFTGAKTLCLPNILSLAGYHTLATNAFYPDFFNAAKAYQSLNFASINFPREYAPVGGSYFMAGDVTGEHYMFDGTLFSQNLVFIRNWIKQNPGRPLLNYVLTIYGHTPHLINTDKRPRMVEVTSRLGGFKDSQLERAVNQYYYRTEAIAAYVSELIRIDPHSIIVLISDHLPSLTYGPKTYMDLHYLDNIGDATHLNRVYIIENGHPTRYDPIHHYDIPGIILSYLTGNKVQHTIVATRDLQKHRDAAALREHYLTVMAHAMDGKPIASFFSDSNVHAR